MTKESLVSVPGSGCVAWSAYAQILLEKPTLFWVKPLLFMSFVKLTNPIFQLSQPPKLATVRKKKGRRVERRIQMEAVWLGEKC